MGVCEEELVENTVMVPEETCSLDPETVCRNVTVSLPSLIPEEKCRVVPREVCQEVVVTTKTSPALELVKYCTILPLPDTATDLSQNERTVLDLRLPQSRPQKLEALVDSPALHQDLVPPQS